MSLAITFAVATPSRSDYMPPRIDHPTAEQKQELLALLTQAQDAGFKLATIAAAIGTPYKTFFNKATSLRVELSGEQTTIRNRFSRDEYEAVKAWWANLLAKLSNGSIKN